MSLAQRVAMGRLSRNEELQWLRSMFPEVPYEFACMATGQDADPANLSSEGAPWNRRKRRSVARCPGRVVEIEKSRVQAF